MALRKYRYGMHLGIVVLAGTLAGCGAPPRMMTSAAPPPLATGEIPAAPAAPPPAPPPPQSYSSSFPAPSPEALPPPRRASSPPTPAAPATGARASDDAAATPSARPPLCALTKTRLAISACDELSEQNALTQAGVDAAPTNLQLTLKQPFTYTYSIGVKGNAAVVARNVSSEAGAVQRGTVAFGHYNYARLTGDGTIKIEALDSEVQDTIANPTPVWRWKLTATEPGLHPLALDAGVELRSDGAAPVRLGQNSKRIDVSVDVSGVEKITRLAGAADTIMGVSTDLLKKLTVLLGAAGAAFAAYRALRGKGKAAAQS